MSTEHAQTRDHDSDPSSRRARRNLIAIVAISALALGILLAQSLAHGHLGGLDEYDDGAYFGATLQLLHGILPYRESAFVQPPMLTVWFLPAAALSLLGGSATAFEAARIFVDLVAATNVAMVGLLLRRRPTLQVVVSMGAMAAFPGAVRSAQTVLIEPLLVFLCLAALLCLLEGGRISTSRRRVLVCGLLFGAAGATKVWALFPFIAVALAVLRLGPRACLTLVLGGASGFVACSAPFFLAAPSAFIHDVFVTQAIRSAGSGYTGWERLSDLTGLPGLYSAVSGSPTSGVVLLVAVLAAIALACLFAFALAPRRSLDALEWCALGATVLTGAGLFVAPDYYYHYGGFEAPFIALLYGAVAVRLRARVSGPARAAADASATAGVRISRPRMAGVLAVTAIPLVLLGAMVKLRLETIAAAPPATQVAAVIGDHLPAKGCVLYTDPAVGILADRFTADVGGCPRVVDWLGEERVLDHGIDESTSDTHNAALQSRWFAAVRASVAMVINKHTDWDAKVTRYARRHFHLAAKHRAFALYLRNRATRRVGGELS
jgi:hypothetical protein